MTAQAVIRMKEARKESPLVTVEDITLNYGDQTITSCSLNLYGDDCRGNGDDEPRKFLDVRRVTIKMVGEEIETDNGDILDFLTQYHYENEP